MTERDLEIIAIEAQNCAAYYQDNPGHFGPEAAVDLYKTIARLSNAVSALLENRAHDPR